MKHLRLFSVVLVAVCALFAVMAATSSAVLPEILPSTVTSYSGKNIGETELLKANGEKVTCTTANGEGTVEANHHLGLFHIIFTGCTTTVIVTVKCTGLGDANAGEILSLGSWHLVWDSLGSSLSLNGVAILFLPAAVHFECAGQLVTVAAGGMILCLVLNPTALTKTFEFHCKKSSAANRPEETKYYNEAGTLVGIAPLMSAKSEGTAEESTQIGLGSIIYPEDALLMV